MLPSQSLYQLKARGRRGSGLGGCVSVAGPLSQRIEVDVVDRLDVRRQNRDRTVPHFERAASAEKGHLSVAALDPHRALPKLGEKRRVTL
jgi:hypothetical protein